MPTITINKKRLLKNLNRKISDEELKEKISMLGTDLEKIEDNEIIVEIFPNRPDYLSEQMFSKALSSFMGVSEGYTEYSSKKLPSDYKVIIDSKVKSVRPYTVCAVVKNLSFDDDLIKEIIQTQEKLHVTFCRNRKKAAIGIYPMENITFPIKFTADSPEKIKFIPLESKIEMNGNEIVENHPTGKQYAHLMQGLEKFSYFIDSNNNILSIPPIINSEITGRVTNKTKDVFIECSGFDIYTLKKVLNIIVCSLAEMGGNVYSIPVIYPKNYSNSELDCDNSNNNSDETEIITPDFKCQEMKIDSEFVSNKLGRHFSKKEISGCLSKMGIGYDEKKEIAFIPPYRADILHKVDLVEDIAIAYGFFEFKPEIPQVATTGKEDLIEIFKKKIRDLMIGFGLIEVKNYNIVSYENQTSKLLFTDEESKDIVVLKNSLTVEYDSLRNNLLSSAMITLKNNKNSDYPQNFFEIGECFSLNENCAENTKLLLDKGVISNSFRFDSKVYDFPKLGVTLCSKESDFTKIKQILDGFFEGLGMNYNLERCSNKSSYIPGRAGDIFSKNKHLGSLGEIHPQVINNFDIEFPISYLELDLNSVYLSFIEK